MKNNLFPYYYLAITFIIFLSIMNMIVMWFYHLKYLTENLVNDKGFLKRLIIGLLPPALIETFLISAYLLLLLLMFSDYEIKKILFIAISIFLILFLSIFNLLYIFLLLFNYRKKEMESLFSINKEH